MDDPYQEQTLNQCLWDVAEKVGAVLHDDDGEGTAKAMMKLDHAYERLRAASAITSGLKAQARFREPGAVARLL